MKRILISMFLLFSVLAPASLALPVATYAVDILPTCAEDAAKVTDYCQDVASQSKVTTNPIISFIKVAINTVSYIGGAAAVIILIVSGIRMIVSNGDSNAVTESRNGVIYSLVGIIVIIFAQTLVIFVLDKI